MQCSPKQVHALCKSGQFVTSILGAALNFTETDKISFEYQNGADRDTLEKLNQYLVTLNVNIRRIAPQFFCTMQAPPRARSSAQSLTASSRASAPICTI